MKILLHDWFLSYYLMLNRCIRVLTLLFFWYCYLQVTVLVMSSYSLLLLTLYLLLDYLLHLFVVSVIIDIKAFLQ